MTFANGAHTGDVTYDAEDRIASIGLSPSASVSFVYDAGGQQKIKVFNDGMGEEVTKYYVCVAALRVGSDQRRLRESTVFRLEHAVNGHLTGAFWARKTRL